MVRQERGELGRRLRIGGGQFLQPGVALERRQVECAVEVRADLQPALGVDRWVRPCLQRAIEPPEQEDARLLPIPLDGPFGHTQHFGNLDK